MSADGAAVFYTSQTLPSSYAKLRQYILHRLFAAPASTALATNASANPTTPTSSSRPAAPAPIATSARASFPFPHRANVVDRDQVLVPAGWDSWGKIKIMRERFDCEQAGEGWEADLERLRAGASGAETDVSGEEGNRGLRREYEMVVVDFEAEDRVSPHLPFAIYRRTLTLAFAANQCVDDCCASRRAVLPAPALRGLAGGSRQGSSTRFPPTHVDWLCLVNSRPERRRSDGWRES